MSINISVIIPSYNRASVIKAAIDSFLAQSYQNWEIIVVDDYSQDNTKDIIESYHDKDLRIKYYLNERKKGAQGARNTGIIHAKYDWILLFDSDNVAHSDMLEKLCARISDTVDVVQCFSCIVDANTGEKIGEQNWESEGYIHKELFMVNGAIWKTYVDFNQSIVRKSKIVEIGLLDEDCPSMQEWDTHLRLSKIARYTTIQESLLDYFVNGTDAISSDKNREVRGRMYILNKYISDWKKERKLLCNYLLQIYMYIRCSKSFNFRVNAIAKLLAATPYSIFAIVLYWKNKLQNFVKSRI